MTELDGPIMPIQLPRFTEAPWIHKHNGWYYLSFASEFPEKICYAMSRNINGPWEYKGILNEIAGNSNTNHQAIIEFKGKSYFIYHNGSINTDGCGFRRAICIDRLYYNEDGTIRTYTNDIGRNLGIRLFINFLDRLYTKKYTEISHK